MKHDNQYYLQDAPILKSLMHLCIPMMLAISAGVIYNIINAYFIGTLHNTSLLAALTFGLPILTIAMAIGAAFGVGGSTYISRLLGEKNIEKIKHVSAFVLYGSILSGIIVTVLSVVLLNPLVHALGADAASFAATKSYSLYLLLCLPVLVANFAMEQVVRAEGAAKESMYGMLLAVVLNLVFDVVLILVLHMSVAGAAIAIGISNFGSLLYYIYFLQKKNINTDLSPKYFSLNLAIAKETFSVGASELLMSSFLIVTTLLLNHFAVQYGDNVLASFGVALRIVQFPEFLAMGLFMGAMPLLAYNYGAQHEERLKQALRQTAIGIGALVVLFSSIVYLLRRPVFMLFTQSNSLITIGVYILIAMLISTIFNGFTGLFITYFQATNKAKAATIMSVTQGVLFIPVVLFAHQIYGLHGVIWSMTITEVLTLVMAVGLFTTSKYKYKPLQPTAFEQI